MNNETEEIRLSDGKTSVSLITQKLMELKLEASDRNTTKPRKSVIASSIRDFEQLRNMIDTQGDAYFLLAIRAGKQEKIDRRLEGFEAWSKSVPRGSIKMGAMKSTYRSLTGLPELERSVRVIDEIIEIIKIR
jgi:hypothetical protein